MGGKKAVTEPPINAKSKEEESFVRYVEAMNSGKSSVSRQLQRTSINRLSNIGTLSRRPTRIRQSNEWVKLQVGFRYWAVYQ